MNGPERDALVPAAGPRRRRVLLATIRDLGGVWTTGRVMAVYRAAGVSDQRSTARGDLAYLARRCLITECGPDHGRHYTLPTTTTGGAR